MHRVPCLLIGCQSTMCIFLTNPPVPPLADSSFSSPLPFYCFPDLWSVNGCLSHWSCGGSLIGWSVRRVELSRWQIPRYNIAACQSLCVYASVTVQNMWLCANRPFLLWVKYYLKKTLILSMCTSKNCLPIEGRYNSNTLDMFSIWLVINNFITQTRTITL